MNLGDATLPITLKEVMPIKLFTSPRRRFFTLFRTFPSWTMITHPSVEFLSGRSSERDVFWTRCRIDGSVIPETHQCS